MQYCQRSLKRLSGGGIAPSPAPNNLLYRRIFDEIAAVYGISPKTIRNSPRRGHITEAKVMAIILISRHADTTHAEIATLFGRGASTVGGYIRAFDRMENASTSAEILKIFGSRSFMPNFNKINATLIKYNCEELKKQ